MAIYISEVPNWIHDTNNFCLVIIVQIFTSLSLTDCSERLVEEQLFSLKCIDVCHCTVA